MVRVPPRCDPAAAVDALEPLPPPQPVASAHARATVIAADRVEVRGFMSGSFRDGAARVRGPGGRSAGRAPAGGLLDGGVASARPTASGCPRPAAAEARRSEPPDRA